MGNKYSAQLYSLGSLFGKDLPNCLNKLSEAGYEGVEFFGGFGKTADEINKMLKDNGLVCSGWHIGIDTLGNDRFGSTVEYLKAVGCKNAVVPGLPGEMTSSAEAWKKTAELFTALSERLQRQGLKLGYHNHWNEVKYYPDGTCPYTVFFDNTPNEVTVQTDIGHVLNGRGLPLDEIFTRYKGRFTSVHLKPYSLTLGAEDNGKGYETYVGEDEIPWKKVLKTLKDDGSTEWYTVELEYSGDKGPVKVLTDAVKFLKDCEKTI